MATAGRILIMPKGAYKSSETYSNLDMVSHNRRCWVAKKVVTGIEPSEENNDYWHDLLGTDLTPEAIGALDKGDIVDNLISKSTELALSANQGKVLKELIDTNTNAITQLNSDKFDKYGGALSGNTLELFNGSGIIQAYAAGTLIGSRNPAFTKGRYLNIVHPDTYAVANGVYISEDDKTYQIFGEHNKPSGTYIGNGSATSRTIATGGIGNELLVYSEKGFAKVYPSGAIIYADGETNVTTVPWSQAHYVNGVLTLTTTNAILNSNGVNMNYECK